MWMSALMIMANVGDEEYVGVQSYRPRSSGDSA
jgi:hypothetical protein